MPTILHEAGLRIEPYSKTFGEVPVSDEVWLREVFRRGWIALSHDRNIRYDRLAQRAVMENGGRIFLLRGKIPSAELAQMFIRGMKSVERVLTQQPAPFIAVVRPVVTHNSLRAEADVSLTLAQWQGGSQELEDEDSECGDDLPL